MPEVIHAFKNAAIAVGDTFVRVPFKMGMSYIQLDSESMYVDASDGLVTDYYVVNVVGYDLADAGKEVVRFSIEADAFHSGN